MSVNVYYPLLILKGRYQCYHFKTHFNTSSITGIFIPKYIFEPIFIVEKDALDSLLRKICNYICLAF